MASVKGYRRSPIFLGERKASLFNRLAAKSIDLLLVVAFYFIGTEIWGPVGVLGATFLCAIQDGLWAGQSVGKRIMGLQVIEDQLGLPCSISNSALRNAPFAVALPFFAISWFWLLFLIVGVPFIVLEIYLLVSLESGVRLGDILGNTLVVEYSEGVIGTLET